MGEKVKEVCPRCGSVIDWKERVKVRTSRNTYRYYLIAVHVDRDTKKRRKCYLGPVEGYVAGAVTHKEHLGGLEGLDQVWDRNKYYLENLLESFLNCSNVKTLKEVIHTTETLLQKLKTHLNSLETQEKQENRK